MQLKYFNYRGGILYDYRDLQNAGLRWGECKRHTAWRGPGRAFSSVFGVKECHAEAH